MLGHSLLLRCPGWLAPGPGRNTSVGALASAGRGRGRGRGRPVEQREGEDQPGVVNAPPPPPRRLSKLFEKYQDADLDAQQEEVFNYSVERAEAAAAVPTARDGRPRTRASKAKEYSKGSMEVAKKRAKMFIFNTERNEDEANIGVYGKGKPCWWALRVNPGREKQVADAIDRLLEYLPPLRINCKDVLGIPREAECWVPSKKVRAWSPKTGKMGNKALKYEDGGVLLVKTIMDKSFVTMMAGNINVLGFQDREVYEGVEFPRPASAELLKTIRDWEADLSDITEEQVKAQLGLDTVVLPATREPSLEEFFYDEDVEASLAAVEEREARRAERGGGRFGARDGGRGTRGGRFGDREERGRGRGRFGASTRGGRGRGGRSSGFFPADDNDSYGDRYSSDTRDSNRTKTGDGWDRPPRRQQQRDQFGSSDTGGGSDWYEGGSSTGNPTGFENDATDDISGWFTSGGAGGTSSTNMFSNDAIDDDIGWFGADTSPPTRNNNDTARDMNANIPSRDVGGDGGLLSDDDDEFWSPAAKDTKKKDPSQSSNTAMNAKNLDRGGGDDDITGGGAIDDLDAIWGAGMGGGDSFGGGWMAMDATNDDMRNRNTSNYRDDNTSYNRERGGGDRGERGRERGGDRGRYGDRDKQYRGGDRPSERGGRFERGGRGRGGRGGSFDEGSRDGTFSRRSSSYRDNTDSLNDSRDTRFSGGDDLSWWDAPGETSGTASASAAAGKNTTGSSTSSPSTSSGYNPSKAAPKEKSNIWNDGDDWFSDDADFSNSSKSSRSVPRGGGSGENSIQDGGGGDADAAASSLSAGTKVEVVSGRFQDFEGVIVESKGERVKAELDVFGTPTVVEISRGEVEPFES